MDKIQELKEQAKECRRQRDMLDDMIDETEIEIEKLERQQSDSAA